MKRGLIFAVANQKGGVGKTTVSVNTAGACDAAGLDVVLVDADPQNTTIRWTTSEGSLSMAVVSLAASGKNIGREILKLTEKYEIVIVDCPGNLEDPRTPAVLQVADFCIIPITPSPADLFSTMALIKKIEEIRNSVNPNLQSALMLNCVNGRTKMREIIIEAIKSEEFGTHLFESQIGQREIYRQTFALGTTIHHCAKKMKGLKEARAEIESFFVELMSYVNNQQPVEARNVE